MKFMRYVFFLIVFTFSCQSNRTKFDREKNSLNGTIDSVKITNHTNNSYIKHTSLIANNAAIRPIENELKNLKSIDSANLKTNNGLYEMIVYRKGSSEDHWEIVLTTFDGVVIYNERTHKLYKNNNFFNLMLNSLDK